MENEKTIRFGVDANAANTAMGRLRADSREMAQSLIDDALKIGKSYKEVAKSIEEALSQMERANQMDVTEQRVSAREQMASGDISSADYDKILKDISEQKDLAKLQVELTRDVIDAILVSGQRELDSNRAAVVEELAQTPFEERTEKQRIQAQLLGLSSDEGRGGGDRGSSLGGLVSMGGTMINSRDPISGAFGVSGQIGGTMMGMGGSAAIVGAVAMLGGMIAKKLWDVGREYYTEAGKYKGITGIDYYNADYEEQFTEYGVSSLDLASRRVPLARARRSAKGLEESLASQIFFEKGAGIDQGLYNTMDQLAVLTGGSAGRDIQSGAAYLRKSGVIQGEDLSAVPDYLQLMVELGKEQVSRLGKVDMGVNMKMVGAIANMDETMRRSPEAVSTMLRAIQGGLIGSAAPQVEALQYSVLSKIRPGASMFELMEMRESPFLDENQRYLPEYLKQLNSISGGKPDMFYATIKQLFGLSAVNARRLGLSYLSGNLEGYLKGDLQGEEGITDIPGRAAGAVPEAVVRAAGWENVQVNAVKNIENAVGFLDQIFQIMRKELPKVNENLQNKHNPYIPGF